MSAPVTDLTSRLLLHISPRCLCYAIMPVSGGSVVEVRCENLPDTSPTERLEALKQAVYGHGDTDGFAGDYASVTCCVDTPRYVVFPTLVCDEALAAKAVSTLWPSESLKVLSCDTGDCGASIVFGLDRGIHAFLVRTFPGIKFVHTLAPVATSLALTTTPDGSCKACLGFAPDGKSFDYAFFSANRLQLLGCAKINCVDDAVYYVASAAACVFGRVAGSSGEGDPGAVSPFTAFITASPETFISFKAGVAACSLPCQCLPMMMMLPEVTLPEGLASMPPSLKMLISSLK